MVSEAESAAEVGAEMLDDAESPTSARLALLLLLPLLLMLLSAMAGVLPMLWSVPCACPKIPVALSDCVCEASCSVAELASSGKPLRGFALRGEDARLRGGF